MEGGKQTNDGEIQVKRMEEMEGNKEVDQRYRYRIFIILYCRWLNTKMKINIRLQCVDGRGMQTDNVNKTLTHPVVMVMEWKM